MEFGIKYARINKSTVAKVSVIAIAFIYRAPILSIDISNAQPQIHEGGGIEG